MSKPDEPKERPLRTKLGLKSDLNTLLLDVPGDILAKIVPLPDTTHVKISSRTMYDFVLAFVESPDGLQDLFDRLQGKLANTGGLWVAWRKNRKGYDPIFGFSDVQNAGISAGLVDVKVCSVSDVWSGLKFMFRKSDR